MGRKGSLRKHQISVVTKFLLMNTIIVTAVIILFVLLIYSFLERKNLQDLNRLRQMTLSNMDYRYGETITSTRNLSYQIFNNNDAIAVMMSKEKDIVHEVRLSRTLEDIMISYPLLQSIYICSNEKVLLRKSSDSNYNLETDGDIFQLIYSNKILTPIKRRLSLGKGKYLNLISLIYHSAYPHNESMNGAVVININEEIFYKLIAPEQLPDGSLLFVVDEKGTVELHENSDFFLRDIKDIPFMLEILLSADEFGSFMVKEKGEDYSANYFKSAEYNHTFISLDAYRSITNEIGTAKNSILIISLLLLILSLGAFFFFTSTIFQPIREIIMSIQKDSGLMEILDSREGANEFTYISQTFSSLLDHINLLEHREEEASYILRSKLFFRLLSKEIKQEDRFSLCEDMEKNHIVFNEDAEYCLLLLRIDNYRDFSRRYSSKSINLVLLSLGRIAGEILAEEYPCQSFESDGDLSAVLIETGGGSTGKHSLG